MGLGLPAGVRGTAHRLRQGLAAIAAALPPARVTPDDGLAAEWLSPPLLALFDGMVAHDRAHALRVSRLILTDGGSPASPELMAAALLHDVGKAGTPAILGRVRLPDRVAKVLLGRFTPGLLDRLTLQSGSPPFTRGLFLAVYHPRLGAERVRDAGGSQRLQHLIAAHEDAGADDPDLRRLIAADARAH